MKATNSILITGGAGFIGSHVVRHFLRNHGDLHVVNLDKLTYAGNLENLRDVEHLPNYTFEKGDITDAAFVQALFEKYNFSGVIHLAAESHVDRSISNPMEFVQTNVVGTVTLLNATVANWKNNFDGKRFYHVSTDEVYGELHNPEEFFTEQTPYDPRSPYSASKAASDHFVRAYGNTFGLPIVISNCSNNYGPNHFPEKLIPLIIHNIITKNPFPYTERERMCAIGCT
jgi:dTDP-glucose 4,6-dehydratase